MGRTYLLRTGEDWRHLRTSIIARSFQGCAFRCRLLVWDQGTTLPACWVLQQRCHTRPSACFRAHAAALEKLFTLGVARLQFKAAREMEEITDRSK